MVQFVAVNKDRHGAKKWRRPVNYSFVAAQASVPVAGAELVRAALAVPLAFAEQAGHYTLVAVLSLVPNRNMFVGPDGRWLGKYAPAWFRVYPFRFLPQKGTNEAVLCVDEESGLIVDANLSGEAFFDADGKLSPALKPVVELLGQLQRGLQATDLAVSALAEAGVVKPWQIKIKSAQAEQAINGLHHVDETALAALSDERYLRLRVASALPIAYAQMLSEGQLGVFTQLAQLHHQAKPPAVAALPESIDSLLLPDDDTIKFRVALVGFAIYGNDAQTQVSRASI